MTKFTIRMSARDGGELIENCVYYGGTKQIRYIAQVCLGIAQPTWTYKCFPLTNRL